MASTSLYRTFSSGNQQTWTWSGWVKKAALCNSANDFILFNGYQNNDNRLSLFYSQTQADSAVNDCLKLFGTASTATTVNVSSSALYRDVNGWYHVVCVFDTTQATGSDRIKIWVNGVQQTLLFDTTPTQNSNQSINFAQTHTVGGYNISGGAYFDGEMAHVHFIDGTAYDADTFGETDSTTGIWKPKTAPSVTYGTNGFFLKFENSGAFGTDSSGNGNTFTVNGTMTQTIDTPSNVFATGNATMGNLTATFSNGNLTVASTGGGNFGGASTLGVSSGKYYAEFKITAQTAACGHLGIDGDPQESARNDHYAGENAWSYGYNANGNKFNNNSGASYGDTFTLNDIIMVAMDLDNNYVYFGKNGTWQNSGDPTSGATGTGAAYSISSSPPSGAYFFVSGDGSGSNSATIAHNYGNGFFATTQVSSAQNPDDGIGIFEYDVPTGYRALCTKSINAEEYS